MKLQFDYKKCEDMYYLYQEGYSLQRIANKYGLSRQRIHDILHHENYTLRQYTPKDYDLILKGYKTCKKCGEIKTLSYFIKVKGKEKYLSYCKACYNIIVRTWARENNYYKRDGVPERAKMRGQEWREKNRKHHNEYSLNYYHKSMEDPEFRKKRVGYAKKANKKRNK